MASKYIIGIIWTHFLSFPWNVDHTIILSICLGLAKTAWSPFCWHGLILIPAGISNHRPSKMWDEITYPFPNFNGATVEVWVRICNLTLHFVSWMQLLKFGYEYVISPHTLSHACNYLSKLGFKLQWLLIFHRWHLGFCKEECTPLERGFDEFYGFYQPLIDYYTHMVGYTGHVGYDLRDGWGVDAANNGTYVTVRTWWRHQMETFSTLLAICAGNSPVMHNGQWCGALIFSLISINGWVNNREAGDLWHHHTHYDVTAMDNHQIASLTNMNFLLKSNQIIVIWDSLNAFSQSNTSWIWWCYIITFLGTLRERYYTDPSWLSFTNERKFVDWQQKINER